MTRRKRVKHVTCNDGLALGLDERVSRAPHLSDYFRTTTLNIKSQSRLYSFRSELESVI